MTATVDANVLVYASNEADEAHPVALALLERLGAGPELLYLFWPVVMGYLRIVTHPAVLPRPLTPATAVENVDGLLTRPHVRSPGESEDFWQLYRAGGGGSQRGNAVPDAHLAALMHAHGVGVIYTRDRSFRRFEGIATRNPFG